MTVHLQRTTSTNSKMGVSFGSYLHALIKIHVSEHKKSVVCIMLLFCVFLDLYNAATRKTRPPMFTEEEECYFHDKLLLPDFAWF